MSRHSVLSCCAVAAALALASCSTPGSSKAKAPEKAPEAVGARYGFHQTYLAARTWAPDVEILRVQNVPVDGLPAPAKGKSYAWEVTFTSANKARAKTYTYSVVEQGNIHEGVFGGPEESSTGSRGQAKAFPTAGFKIDSVQAWETAAAKSKEYMDKNPDKPITFLLERTPRHPSPAWRVIWGTSAATSNYSIYVDAATGDYLERMR